MPAGSGFNDDFFSFALSRARSPIGDFLQSATPQVGRVDLGWEPVRGKGPDIGGAPAVGHINVGGVEDFLRPLQIIQQGQQRANTQIANLKAAKEQGEKPQAQLKPGQPAPPAAPAQAQRNVVGPVPAAGLEGISLSGLGPGNRQEFLRRAMALGQALEDETGIPAELFTAMAANESNFGNAPGNIMGGVKPADRNDPRAIWLDTWEMENGQRVNRREPFLPSSSALEGMRLVANTLQSGRYANAYQQLRAGQISPETFIFQVNRAGYATNPNWATGEIIPLMQEAAQHRGGAAELLQSIQNDQVTRDAAVHAVTATAPNGISQYDVGLPKSVADAFCGPAAALWFVDRYGRTPTAMEALNLAKEVGWNQSAGMAGPQSEVRLLNRMGVPARLAAPDPNTIRAEIEAGRPVIIDTEKHYFQVIGYNAQTGGFVMGDAVGRRAGQNGIRLENLASLGFGPTRTAILANMNFPQDAQL